MSDTVQDHFERNRNLLLDFLCRMARPLGNDLRIGVGDVGVGLDGQIVEGNDAPDEEHERPTQTPGGGCAGQNRSDAESFALLRYG